MSILVLTSDTLIGTPATGNLEYNGQFYGTDSALSRAQMQRIAQGTAVASTSGTSIDFTSLPAWVKKIIVMFNGVSTSAGTGDLLIQIGSGSVTTTGYLSGNILINNTTPSTSNFTSGIAKLPTGGATANMTGILFLTNLSGNLWVASATAMSTSTLIGGNTTGSISLGGVLDRVRITTTNGTDTFDAGSVNILYEG